MIELRSETISEASFRYTCHEKEKTINCDHELLLGESVLVLLWFKFQSVFFILNFSVSLVFLQAIDRNLWRFSFYLTDQRIPSSFHRFLQGLDCFSFQKRLYWYLESRESFFVFMPVYVLFMLFFEFVARFFYIASV